MPNTESNLNKPTHFWTRLRKSLFNLWFLFAIATFLLIAFISWRGYIQIRTFQNAAALEGLGFYVDSPVESRKRLRTPWGSLLLWEKKAGYYEISSARRLQDRDLPEVIEALKRLDRPFAFSLSSSELTTLEGIEVLTNLRSLDVYDQRSQLQDISALKNMTWIRSLSLSNANELKSIESIGTLSNLVFLGVGGEKISDLTPLHRLGKLASASFHRCNVTEQQIEEFRIATGSTANISWSPLKENAVGENDLQTREPTHAERLAP